MQNDKRGTRFRYWLPIKMPNKFQQILVIFNPFGTPNKETVNFRADETLHRHALSTAIPSTLETCTNDALVGHVLTIKNTQGAISCTYVCEAQHILSRPVIARVKQHHIWRWIEKFRTHCWSRFGNRHNRTEQKVIEYVRYNYSKNAENEEEKRKMHKQQWFETLKYAHLQ